MATQAIAAHSAFEGLTNVEVLTTVTGSWRRYCSVKRSRRGRVSNDPAVAGWTSVEKRAVLASFLCLVLIAGWTNYSLPLYLTVLTGRGIPLSHAAAGTSVLFVAGAL